MLTRDPKDVTRAVPPVAVPAPPRACGVPRQAQGASIDDEAHFKLLEETCSSAAQFVAPHRPKTEVEGTLAHTVLQAVFSANLCRSRMAQQTENQGSMPRLLFGLTEGQESAIG